MVDQIQNPKVNTYANIGGGSGVVVVSKVTMYAIVNNQQPPPPPPPGTRRRASVTVDIHRVATPGSSTPGGDGGTLDFSTDINSGHLPRT